MFLNSNPLDGSALSLGNLWEPRTSKMAAVIFYTTSCLDHNFGMHTHAFAYEEFNGPVYNNVRLCSRDHNSKWPPFSPTIVKIELNWIELSYINMTLFCPFLFWPYQEFKTISTDARLLKLINIQDGRYLKKEYARATILCLFLSLSVWARTQYWYILVLP